MGSLISGAFDGFRVALGQRLPLFRPGRNKPSLSSSEDMNKLVMTLNALTNIRVDNGEVSLTDSNLVIRVPKGGTPGEAGPPGPGNMNYRGEYSASTNYAVFDVVFTDGGDAGTGGFKLPSRLLWIASQENGPGSTVVTPQWPDTSAWTCLSLPGLMDFQITSQDASSLYGYYWSGTGTIGVSTSVAKPPLLRQVGSRTIDGTPWTYTSYNWTTQTRVAQTGPPGALVTETQVIVDRYNEGDIVTVGLVYDLSQPPSIRRQDLNIDARKWAKKYGT